MKKSNWNLTLQSPSSCREQNYNENNILGPDFHMWQQLLSLPLPVLPICIIMDCRASSKGFSAEEPHTASAAAQHIPAWMPNSLELETRPWLASVLQSSKTCLVHTERQTNSLLTAQSPNYFVRSVLNTPTNSRILWAPDCLSCFCRCCYCSAVTASWAEQTVDLI